MPTAKRVFGYCRVSSQGQNLDRQIDALKAAGVNERDIFTDKASGKDFRRQAYETMKSLLREGDELVILDLDRLGRNYEEIQNIGTGFGGIDGSLFDTCGMQSHQ